MSKRYKTNTRKSKKMFSRTAGRSRADNAQQAKRTLMRGGYRL